MSSMSDQLETHSATMAAAQQQFCVKWNSYSTNLQSVFPRLLTSEHFVDVTLACEGQMIKCHKVVLSACSTYFERLLVANPCPHPIIFMKDMKHFEVQALVDFMYRGEVNVSQDELNSLLVAAEALQIRGLCGSDNMNAVNGRPHSGSHGFNHAPPSPRAGSSGNETEPHVQPTKRRREDADHRPRIVSVTSNGEEVRFADSPKASARDAQQNIKQESLDVDDHFAPLEHDGDAGEDGYERLEQQDDSDGNHADAHTERAGPSGLSQTASRTGTVTPDKAATGSLTDDGPREESSPDVQGGRNAEVEISPSSGVRVSEEVWHRVGLVTSPTQVVRRLLLALFSAETLMSSNLRGGKCKNKSMDSGHRRKLDEHVTNAIYDATVKRFPSFSRGSFGVAVNSKIAELRFHKNKKTSSFLQPEDWLS